jgi:hypothetical protein
MERGGNEHASRAATLPDFPLSPFKFLPLPSKST